MTVDDILMLARRGFTAEQIAALAAVPTTQAAPAPAPDPAPVQPEAPAQPAPAPQPTQPVQPAAPDQSEEILRKLGVLTDAIQASAILQSQQPKQETADDILAAIIAPPIIKKE